MAVSPPGGPFRGPDCPKWPFWGPKMLFLARNHFLWTPVQRIQQKNVVSLVSRHGGDKKIGRVRKKMDLGPKNCIFDQKFCIFLRYTYETTLFLARTVPTQWDDNSSISWGNSGYLAGWSPGGHQGPFLGQKWPKILFFPIFKPKRDWVRVVSRPKVL